MTIRTRFAPSPTGFIHLGNIRSALYPWAFARAMGGEFILRIEDTDEDRNSQEAVDMILEAMKWLGLNYDEGPYYQSRRMDRYKEVLADLIEREHIYPCYMSHDELEALRARQTLNKEKPRYDGTWRPEPGKKLPPQPIDAQPVWRFRNPQVGSVVWDDKVKGRIEVQNSELDDFVVARSDGTPTYNFCVVVDDYDMKITHVIRGDDHVNNTPRQINVLRAMGVEPPVYAHLPTVLNDKGEKLSKRTGAKSVMAYAQEGLVPSAMVNYLARLGWSHGDDEIFTREQFVKWFDLEHLGTAPARVDEKKLRWVNAQHIKTMTPDEFRTLIDPELVEAFMFDTDLRWKGVFELFKDRVETLTEMVKWVLLIIGHHSMPKVDDSMQPVVNMLIDKLRTCEWTEEAVNAAIQGTLADANVKMKQLAPAVRQRALGVEHAPGLAASLVLIGRDELLNRIA